MLARGRNMEKGRGEDREVGKQSPAAYLVRASFPSVHYGQLNDGVDSPQMQGSR